MLWREERIEVVGNLGYRYLTLSPALYVSQPSTQGVDLIPPGRIVDLALVSVSTVQNNVKVSLRFTEPGDDNFDNGVPQLYYIHCGERRENISYQLCSSIRGRVRLPATPRKFKIITLIVKNFDVEVYIGITAQDRSGNMGEMSNIVEVYISSSTTTSTSSTTISTTVIPDEITESKGSEGVSLVLFWSIVAPLLALLIILLLCLLIFVFSWNYRKKRERRLLLEEDMRTYRLQDNPEFQVSCSPEAAKNVRFIKRSRTKTNGSLRDIEKPLSDSSSHSDSESKEKARRRRKKRKGCKTDIPDPVYTISQTINHIKFDQDKRDDHFYPNSSLESKPGAYRYKTRTKGLAPGLSKDHNPKYLNNNPPGRVGPPVLPKPSYYNPNSSSRVPQNIQIVEPVEDNYGSSQPSNYLSYINNNRLPAIYSTESTVNSEIMKNYEKEFEPRSEKRKPFNYIVQSEELSLNKPSNKKNSKNFVSFV
ncbi:uncharacterized protein LOC111711002 isoform X3 [Eurytemora carolleeae]|uniref:uncharacterized protein LOC111711002 isoform X3 n=1 Tax=Eurytemora carolleeae TaxID=1294199 RepID=UPI000C774A97|nr:uncharacterized protein LOC111711002 isoform X3 [Eurytemora carolleeae]|eukprot:XP_023340988.1 uncharacterized protein LOC111711002 isoform X3 [Eurytemora affinis]